MANITGSYNSNQSYNPKFVYTVGYSQTGRSGSAVTYNFNVGFTRTNGSYAYDIIINWNIGGVTGSKTILAANNGSATGSTSFSVTCATNASGGTLGARIYTSSATDSTHWMSAMDTGSQTVTKSTFNTTPSISGKVTAAGTTVDGYVSEYTGNIDMSWPSATDPNGNLSGYRVRVSINGGGYSELGRTSGGTYSHKVSGYGEGTSFRYCVDAYDSYSAWSGPIYSGTIRKNVLNGGGITKVSPGVSYSEYNQTMTINFSAGSNSNGTSVSYLIYSDTITVYNQRSISLLTETLTIWRTGTTPSGPYIKWDDIKTNVAGSGYAGNLQIALKTTNNYGTNRWSVVNTSIDIRTNPNPVGSASISVGTASTAYIKNTGTGLYYFVPKAGRVIQVVWGSGSGKNGETIKYDLYVSYDSGAWQLVANNLSSSTLSYSHDVDEQSSLTTIKYRVRTKTSYDYYSDIPTTGQNLHYYNSPHLYPGTITRESTKATAVVTIKSNSSIPNINTTGTWIARKTGTPNNIATGNLTISQTNQNIVVNGLTDIDTYVVIVTYNDNTGWASNGTGTITIASNSPVFFINKYGVGVGGVKANVTYGLNVNGNSNFNGSITTTDIVANGSITTTDILATGSGKQIRIHQPNTACAWIETNATDGLYMNQRLYVKGEIYAGASYENRVYHTAWKPTSADVGAIAISGDQYKDGRFGATSVSVGSGLFSELSNGSPLDGIGRMDSNLWGPGPPVQLSGNFGVKIRANVSWIDVRYNNDSVIVGNSLGYARLGARNAKYFHFDTDRPLFYMYKPLQIQGSIHADDLRFNTVSPSIIQGRSGDGGLDVWCKSGGNRFSLDGSDMIIYKVVGGIWTRIAG